MRRVAVLMLNGTPPSREVTGLTRKVLEHHALQLRESLRGLGVYSFRVLDPIIDQRVHKVKERMARYLGIAKDLVDSDGDVVFLFFYLGHADVLDGDLRFIGPAFDLETPGSMYSTGDLWRDIASYRLPKSIIILDCCYAGFAEQELRTTLDQQSVYLMASTTPSHSAQLRPDRPVGVFTDELLGALEVARLAPDARHHLGDPEAPGQMTFRSLFRSVTKRVREYASEQLPIEQGALGKEVVRDLDFELQIQDAMDQDAPRKSYYRKFYMLLRYLRQRTFDDLAALRNFAESQQDREFQTPVRDARTGNHSYECIGIPKFAEYVRVLRLLGLVDPESLRLTKQGRTCVEGDGAKFNSGIYGAAREALKFYGIEFKTIETVAWRHAQDFRFTTAPILYNALGQQAASPAESVPKRLSFTIFRILLEVLARTKALRTNEESVFLPK